VDVPDPTIRQDTSPAGVDDRQGTPIPRAKRLSRGLQIALLAALAALLLAAIVLDRRLDVQQADSQAGQNPAQTESADSFKPTEHQWAGFAIAPVSERQFSRFQETDGKIAYDDDLTTPVFSPFTGRVTKVTARMGDRVKRGDPLATIQAAEFVQAENDLITAAAALRTARAQLNLAQTNEKRQHALYLAQGGALKDWQQSQVDLSTAEGALHGAEIALATVRNRLRILGKTDPEIDEMQTAQDITTFSPDALILAPVDGVVIQRQIGLGQNVASQSNGGSTAVFSIGDPSKVWLLANVREADAPLIHIGDAVQVRVPAYPNRVFDGHLSYVAPSIDPNTHRLPVHAELDNDDLALKPEMLATFRITTGDAVTAPAVPEGALVYEGESVHVWVANDALKTISLRKIRIGRIEDGMAQVTDGLTTGDHVVTAGSLFLDRAVGGD
jgi:membrane fusion protein, heavy metal efflux system